MARSAWLRHVMAVRGQNKGMAFKDVLKLAKRSYKKGGGMQGGNKFESQPASVGGDAPAPVEDKNGGQDGGEAAEAPQEGGRRRRRRGSRKSRRKSRKGKSRRKSRRGKSRKGRKTKRRRRRRR
jgi:hypothetical protein